MKIVVERKKIAEAMADAMPFCPQKTQLQVLKYAKISTNGNRMKIEVSNDHSAICKYIEVVECDMDGSFLVEADSFGKFINKVKTNDITIENSDNTLTIIHGKGRANFQVMSETDYPSFEMPEEITAKIEIPTSILNECVAIGKNFVGTDDFRPMMKAIYAYVRDGKFGYCATDTRALINDFSDIENAGEQDFHWYIEPFIFSALQKSRSYGETVTVTITPTAVSYRIGNTIIYSLQTQARFPDFNRIIPKSWNTSCVIDKNDTLDSLSRVMLFCSTMRLIKVKIGQMDVSLSSENLESMKDSSETMLHHGCDGEIVFGVNADLLQSCVNACASDEINVYITNPTAPILIKDSSKTNMSMVLMPMSLI